MALNNSNQRHKSDRKQLFLISGTILVILAAAAACITFSWKDRKETAGPAVTAQKDAAKDASVPANKASAKETGEGSDSKTVRGNAAVPAAEKKENMIVLTDKSDGQAGSADLTITAENEKEKTSQTIVVQTDGLQGDNAACDAGLAWEKGTGGHGIDYEKAAYWYAKGVKEGSTCAMNNLGYMYMQGAGVQKDNSSAFALFQLSAEKGDPEGAFAAGYMTERGWGTEYNVRRAFGFYAMAAEKGYAPAENAVGTMFESGAGVEKSYEKAFKWYELAARDGDLNALYNLADKYRQGKGTAQDNGKAFELFGQAARKGNAYAQYDYGSMLAAGLGTEKNLVEAYAWLKLSTDTLKQGDGILGAVSYLLSEDDRAKAEQLAAEYKKKYASASGFSAVSVSHAGDSEKAVGSRSSAK